MRSTRRSCNRTPSTRRRRLRRGALGAAATIAVVATLSVGAGAASAGGHGGGGPNGPGPKPPAAGTTTLADGLIGPLHLDVSFGRKGPNILVSQSFVGSIGRIAGGTVTDVVTEPGGFTGGVAAGPFGTVLYLVGSEDGSFLKIQLPDGTKKVLADLGTHESTRNPDRINTYGLQGASDECLAQLPPELPLAPYTGDINSNPYELLVTPFGVYVADAGANAILFVEWSGKIRTIAVLPPRPEVITAQIAEGAGLPDCTVGLTMNFEPVPTDVEVGPGRQLYVSSLPGGPEDASLGARGGVFKVHPISGRTQLIGTGFLGATNLAVSPGGTVYVAELFGGRVSKLTRNGPVTVRELNEPAAVEFSGGRLYVTTDVNTVGKVVTFSPRPTP